MASKQELGVLAGARESFLGIFRWRTRVVVVDEHGNESIEWQAPEWPANPFRLLGMLTANNWLFYIVGFLGWTFDAYDFHALSIQQTKLALYFKVDKTTISTAITLTLLLRSVGAVIFGVAGDYFGRKWPFVINMLLLGALQIGSVHAPDFNTFLAVRAIFGIAMGGVFGGAASMALENVPSEARGLLSGIFQQGYSFGYVIAACANLGVGGATDSWPTMFYIGAGGSFAVGIIRIFFPESRQFIEAKKNGGKGGHTGAFMKEAGVAIKQEWRRIIYFVILMALFNFFSHTTQDSYTTFMKVGKALDNAAASRASILMKTGACVGGTIIGYLSQSIGRRRAIVIAAIMAGLLIPAWILPSSESGLEAGGFMLQFFVQGAWGVIPVHLQECSPPAFRASFPGITYQLGNAISSPSAQIVNELAEKVFTVMGPKGKRVEAYGPVMGVATAIIATLIAVWTAVGPEKKGSRFEEAAAAGAGPDLGNPQPLHKEPDHLVKVDSLEKRLSDEPATLTRDASRH